MGPDKFFRTGENRNSDNKSDRQHRDAKISNQNEIHCHFIGDTNVSYNFVRSTYNAKLITYKYAYSSKKTAVQMCGSDTFLVLRIRSRDSSLPCTTDLYPPVLTWDILNLGFFKLYVIIFSEDS